MRIARSEMILNWFIGNETFACKINKTTKDIHMLLFFCFRGYSMLKLTFGYYPACLYCPYYDRCHYDVSVKSHLPS